jgi:serine/threonine-protein kinase haspin
MQWLHYLSLKLLNSKRLKPPVAPRKGRATDAPSPETAAFTEKDCYDCLVDIEAWLGQCVSGLAKPEVKSKGKKKMQMAKPTPIGPTCAGEVVAYAVKKGWVMPTS